ncbi:hypothetical protein PIB30_039185 [Stylosanthes scabra]|uniref:Uncharacterized protein n=1 Tax=Stylosanthes scabra TaxID=79078 RepID=A0ABU6XDV4_9FABA|nr:hypothetical protein [Stylosanthes scabra]
MLGRPTLQTAGFKLDYITNAFSFKVGKVEEVYHPKKPSAVNKKSAHQKKKKDPTKKKVEIRKRGEDSSKGEKEEEKERRKLELKFKSVEEFIGKLYAFKKALHHNDAMNHHLVKDQSKWK